MRVLLSEYGGSACDDWFVSANVDQIRARLERSYCPPDLYSIESLWIFDVNKALNFNFHTMGQKLWGFWTIVHSQMTIDLGELAQYVFLPWYSPDLAPLDFLCFLPYGKTTEEAFCIFKSNSKWFLVLHFAFRIWRKCP
jgi:hypothetical protein